MSPDATIRHVTDATELQDLYAALLAPSFPPSELVPTDWLIDGVASGAVSVLVTEDESGPVAIAVTEPLEPSPAVLLTYFATRADRRGQGLGSRLFETMVTAVRERTHSPLLVAEVERPDRHTGSPEFGDPAARLRFYERHGARVLDLPYFQPPIGAGEPVHGMLLLALHVKEDLVVASSAGGQALPGDLVAPAIEAILDEVQPSGPAPAADRLRAAARRPEVPLWSAAEYARAPSSVPDPAAG